MRTNGILRHAIRAMLGATAGAAATISYAQTASNATPAAVGADLSEIVVTGSRIQNANLVSLSPITTVTNLEIAQSGLTRVEDILNNLPQVFAGQGSSVQNGSDGTATLDLHDLGPQRTLVLVNGRRLAPGAPNGRNFADVNQIPPQLIERIDVLTGGASSTYGADAVSGVVNFIMNTHYEGVKVDVQYGMYNHDNHDTQLQGLVGTAGYPVPTGDVNAGFNKSVSFIAGSNFADGAGNATFYATYDKQNSSVGGQYDYGGCSLGFVAGAARCSGSPTNAGGTFVAYNASGNILNNTVSSSGLFRPVQASDNFNFGALNYFIRPDERWTAGTFINIDLNSHANVYSEFMFMRNDSTSGVAPSGDFANNQLSLNCGPVGPGLAGNPLITAQERGILCDPSPTGLLALQGQPPGGTLSYYLERRNVEGGQRLQTFTNDDFRTVIGIKGDFLDAWKYDAYAQIGITDATSTSSNFFSTTNLAFAENPVTNATGAIVCAPPAPANCVPYNPWVPGAITPAALNYLTIPLQDQGTAREYVVSANLTGDLGKYGLQIPWAKSGPQVNLGAEYRSESTNFNPDLAEQQGIAAGGPGKVLPIAGNFHVSEVFTEFTLPVAEGLPFADELAISGGYRYSKYTLGFTTNTYKVGLEWAPIKDIKFRGTFNQAVRAPNIAELFTAATVGPGGTIDPCWGPTPSLTQAQCALTGVTAAQYGHLGVNPASQFNTKAGGNPNLSPEIAHTWTYGLVFQPSFLPQFFATVDYYDIRITGAIEAQSGVSIILNCALTDNAADCAAIHRNPNNGSLYLTTDGFVDTPSQNTGVVENKGVDVNMRYGLPLDGFGKLVFSLIGTDNISNITQPNASVVNPNGSISPGPSYDCTGYEGSTCHNPLPRWRSTLSTDWATPWQGLDLNLRWRYIGDTKVDALSQSTLLSSPSTVYPFYNHIPSFSYIDLSAAVAINSNFSVRVGANNVLDKDPPIVLSGNCPVPFCSNNTYVQVYDPMGRFLYVNLTAKF